MIQVKDTEKKVTNKSRTIKIKDAILQDGTLIDEYGDNVIEQIEKVLPEGVDQISFSIKVELPDDEEDEYIPEDAYLD